MIYLTMEQIKNRPQDGVILDGVFLTARDPFSVAQIQQPEELEPTDRSPADVLRAFHALLELEEEL